MVSTQLLTLNYLLYSPADAAPQFLGNLPLYSSVFKRGAHFLEPTCLPNTRILLYKSAQLVQLCWWYKIEWSKQWFLIFSRASIWVIFVFNQTRGKMRVWYFYSQVSQWKRCEFVFVFVFVCIMFSFGEKKTGLTWSNLLSLKLS